MNDHLPAPLAYTPNTYNGQRDQYPDWMEGSISTTEDLPWRVAVIEDVANPKATAELLAAAYTAFDKAGRELGVDAAELARSLDIAEALNLLGDCIPYLCDAMDSRANETEHSKKARALSVRINAIAFPRINAAFRADKARQAAK